MGLGLDNGLISGSDGFVGVARFEEISVPQLAHGLREVHFDAAVVDQHVVHLLIRLKARRSY